MTTKVEEFGVVEPNCAESRAEVPPKTWFAIHQARKCC
jgi:hypothetical protein